jgi:hypothetical protein
MPIGNILHPNNEVEKRLFIELVMFACVSGDGRRSNLGSYEQYIHEVFIQTAKNIYLLSVLNSINTSLTVYIAANPQVHIATIYKDEHYRNDDFDYFNKFIQDILNEDWTLL